ncbi:MAG: DEAD/DEAH box helicase [Chlamydiales bacterium]|nr:DEAD/DEAH box helicase [Chlamydiales bacterium]
MALQVKGFEERLEQRLMSQDVLAAFTGQHPAFIEAGTGTGKSLAYLIPAILWAEQHDERVVISTNTIALQEQLIYKDIPLAIKTLGLETKYVLAKGMSNYACLRRLDDVTQQQSLFKDESADELFRIHEWSRSTAEGTRSSLPFLPTHSAWDQVSVQSELCDGPKCEHFNKCFFFKAKLEVQNAKIIVVNHHLLLADLAMRIESNNFNQASLLPLYKRLIIDEAHHIEDIATEYFASKVSRLELMKIISYLGLEFTGKVFGRLGLLRQKLILALKNTRQDILHFFEDLSNQRKSTLFLTDELFDSVGTFCTLIGPSEQKLRILEHHITHPYWTNTLLARSSALSSQLVNFAMTLQQLEHTLVECKSESLDEQTKALRLEIKALSLRLASASEKISAFFKGPTTKEIVFWIQQEARQAGPEVQLVSAQPDVSELLRKNLFDKMATTVLCSATLATNKSFSFAKRRLGLQNHPTTDEKIHPSPFDYKKQALIGVPIDMPFPDSADFTPSCIKAIKELVIASQGNAFVLFTSYEALKTVYQTLFDDLQEQGYHMMKQGDDHRHALITRFKAKPRSILFATDSFWEGIDIVGDALRLVIITKLPFPVPSDPISQARSDVLAANGKSAFVEYSLPKAAVKFKQGFGRLIRSKDDRGCFICLDSRLIKKHYGKVFLQSLPECQEVFEPLATLKQKMIGFYRNKA